ncbi:MAG: hypothetical protein HUK21_11795 [Fibrobacteraceae bacterium]|nr:hypothetical protein [Fibrobacteraceae bacterium]
MNKTAVYLLFAITSVFAVHPALQDAIDNKNYKQAENLVKNIGIKDVYCPSNLSPKDADKIYGNVFADSIGLLLDNCDTEFSVTYLEFKCAGGKDKSMCLNLINFINPESWSDKYPKMFCTKKNVEICAAAVDRVPVEKSVPWLKAIKANKLAEAKAYEQKKMRASGMTKAECENLCNEIKNAGLAEVQRRLDRSNFSWRLARSEGERYMYEKEIKDLERQQKEIRSKSCNNACRGNLNQAVFESFKVHQYYFDDPFMNLSQKAAWYYINLDNPLIPGLAENWDIVDKLFMTANEANIKSIEKMTDTTAMVNAVLDFSNKFDRYPNFINKKLVVDTLKSAFGREEKIDILEQLLYCKIYPSIDKEMENLFGTKIIDCKALLNENAKLFEPCSDGETQLERSVYCENGRYKRDYWQSKSGEIVVMQENIFTQPNENVWCPPTGIINCMRKGPLYTSYAAKNVCPAGWRLPTENELEYIERYIQLEQEPNLGYRDCDKKFHNVDKKSYYFTKELSEERGIKYYYGSKCNTANEMYSVRCILNDVEGVSCNQNGECFKKHCCDNGVLREASKIEIDIGKVCDVSKPPTMFSYHGSYIVCDSLGYRNANDGENFTKELCTNENLDSLYIKYNQGYVCSDSGYRKANSAELLVKQICDEKLNNQMFFEKDSLVAFVCNQKAYRKATPIEFHLKKTCTAQRQDELYWYEDLLYICDQGKYRLVKESDLNGKNKNRLYKSSSGKISLLFKDMRDGTTYKTVRIDGVTWMTENLKYKKGQYACFDDKEENCRKNGPLYKWGEAKDNCPFGWRLPTHDEVNHLLKYAKLKEKGKGGRRDIYSSEIFRAREWNQGTDRLGLSFKQTGCSVDFEEKKKKEKAGFFDEKPKVYYGEEASCIWTYGWRNEGNGVLEINQQDADLWSGNSRMGNSVRCVQGE